MKHIILTTDNIVEKIGENYSTHPDYIPQYIIHNVDGMLFDQNFKHETVEEVPQEVLDNPMYFKYENGEFRKRISLQKQIEEQLILALIAEGTL